MEEKYTPYYAGDAFANPDYADGQLPHAVGASNYQVTRANRRHPEWSDGMGNTYNHAPMLTYWRGTFYLEYLSNPIDEHTDGGCSFMCMSKDGVHWTAPQVVFPVIKAPRGIYKCEDGEEIVIPEDREAIMHQRMGFFHSSDNRLLVSGFYGHVPNHYTTPWGKYGMGRVVREVYEDGTLGPIYFIRILTYSGWTEEKLPFPHYSKSDDAGFVAVCEELLKNRLVTQQWAEEHGDRDEYVHIKQGQVQLDSGGMKNAPEKQSSFCWYHLDEQNIVGMWKHAVVGRSQDGGDTWRIVKEPSFATTGAKMWGQKTEDGKYLIAYVNSIASEHRYPLCAAVSDDGIRFDELAVICGEVPARRYKGLFKDYGPQYIRGICEGHGEYPKGAMWLCHSMNKEDMWVTRVPVPYHTAESVHADDDFSGDDMYIQNWNVYSPLWAPVRREVLPGGVHCMAMRDHDPVDYARAERIFKAEKRVRVSVTMMPSKFYEEDFFIELADDRGQVACRLTWGKVNALMGQTTSVMVPLQGMKTHLEWTAITIEADCERYRYAVYVNGQATENSVITMRQKVNSISRLILRTKMARKAPGVDVRPDAPDMKNADEPARTNRAYFIRHVKTEAME